MIEMKILDNPQGYCKIWTIPLFGMYVFEHPTWNCQLFTVANIQGILFSSIDKQIEVLKTIARTTNKPRMLVDVRETHSVNIEKLFTPDQIIFKQPYVSSNKHDMIIYQIDVTHLNKE